MAGRVFLIARDSPDPSADYDAKLDVMLSARGCVPVFWLTLFGSTDACNRLVRRRKHDGSGMLVPVPGLFVDRRTALMRLCERRGTIFRYIPAARALFDEFAGFMGAQYFSYVQLDTDGLGGPNNKEVVRVWLHSAVRAFETEDPDDLRNVFEVQSLEFDPQTRRVLWDWTSPAPITDLCGHAGSPTVSFERLAHRVSARDSWTASARVA